MIFNRCLHLPVFVHQLYNKTQIIEMIENDIFTDSLYMYIDLQYFI